MKKNLLTLLISLFAFSTCVFVLTACQENEPPHEHSFTNYISNNDATYDADGTKTATCDIDGCNQTDIITDIGSKLIRSLKYTLNTDGESYSVTGIGSYIDTHLVIPETYNNKPVTKIGDDAFEKCLQLTSVEIPNSITSIGLRAFIDCYRLVEVVNKSTHISLKADDYNNGYLGYYALKIYNSQDNFISSNIINDNDYLVFNIDEEKILINYIGSETNLILPNYVTRINRCAFYKNQNLTSVIIPNSVESIGEWAFRDCSNLTNFNLNDKVKKLEYLILSNCSKLTSITIPASVTEINDRAFLYSNNLVNIKVDANNTQYKDIDGNLYSKNGTILIRYAPGKTQTEFIIPNSVTSIESYAFESCTANIRWENNSTIREIGYYSFCDYKGTSIELPDTLITIGYNAFFSCSNLIAITIPNSVTSIGYSAFAFCKSLTNITIPSNVLKIGGYAFRHCDNLTSITFSDTSSWYITENRDDFATTINGTLIDVTNASTNATNFLSNYYNYYWYKK